MTTSLITGANKGLGFETARQLITAGHRSGSGHETLPAGGKRPTSSARDSYTST